jgi:hypothetical protein
MTDRRHHSVAVDEEHRQVIHHYPEQKGSGFPVYLMPILQLVATVAISSIIAINSLDDDVDDNREQISISKTKQEQIRLELNIVKRQNVDLNNQVTSLERSITQMYSSNRRKK